MKDLLESTSPDVPEVLIPPSTLSFEVVEVVPIPTLPPSSILNKSVPALFSISSAVVADVVPDPLT